MRCTLSHSFYAPPPLLGSAWVVGSLSRPGSLSLALSAAQSVQLQASAHSRVSRVTQQTRSRNTTDDTVTHAHGTLTASHATRSHARSAFCTAPQPAMPPTALSGVRHTPSRFSCDVASAQIHAETGTHAPRMPSRHTHTERNMQSEAHTPLSLSPHGGVGMPAAPLPFASLPSVSPEIKPERARAREDERERTRKRE